VEGGPGRCPGRAAGVRRTCGSRSWRSWRCGTAAGAGFGRGEPGVGGCGPGLFSISVAAELTGLHPQTLRIYEREGLIDPARSAGGTRHYSSRDIRPARRAKLAVIRPMTHNSNGTDTSASRTRAGSSKAETIARANESGGLPPLT
jgi:MerR family transcriptional regulator, heat shock protein HspR